MSSVQTKGDCKTVKCSPGPWSEWSATCGPAVRSMTLVSKDHVVKAKSCANFPTACSKQVTPQSRYTPLCKFTKYIYLIHKWVSTIVTYQCIHKYIEERM